jgi:Na+-driven multidrug efflux pump
LGAVKKEILIGFLVGLFATFGGIFLYLEYFSKFNFDDTLQMIDEGNLYGKVLSLAAIPNLFVFFIFIKKKQDNSARGVLIATFLIAFTTLILKFF